MLSRLGPHKDKIPPNCVHTVARRRGRGARAMAASVWITLAAEVLVFALLLFGAAGTPRWLAGWVFLVLFFGGTLHITRTIARHDPALLAERMKPPIQRNQPLWDKVLLSTLIV